MEEERVQLLFKCLNYDLLVLFVHMNFKWKEFNELLDYVKKLEGGYASGSA